MGDCDVSDHRADVAGCLKGAPITVIGLAHEPLVGHRKVVLHWGELGTRWGISLTVAQIHALLYSRSALSAEEIADAISVARCKVSTSLKEL
jgi:hypothetical protein